MWIFSSAPKISILGSCSLYNLQQFFFFLLQLQGICKLWLGVGQEQSYEY